MLQDAKMHDQMVAEAALKHQNEQDRLRWQNEQQKYQKVKDETLFKQQLQFKEIQQQKES